MNHLLTVLVRWLRSLRKVPSCETCRYPNLNGVLRLCGHPKKVWEIAAYEREYFVDHNLPDGKCGPDGKLYEPKVTVGIDPARPGSKSTVIWSRNPDGSITIHERRVTP